jgi:FkbM family methyltransferase
MTVVGHRTSALLGVLAGVAIGGSLGIVVGRIPEPAPNGRPTTGPAPRPQGRVSYAQQGEDLVVAQILFEQFPTKPLTYIDIGAHDPIQGNNTYFFYKRGARGVLVEPNPYYADKLRQVRPEDQVVQAGLGPNVEDVFADYYTLPGDGQLNTFSKTQADEIVKRYGPQAIASTTKIKLININKVLAQYFPNGAPDFLSIDTEGLDLDILRSLDFTRFRPKVVCAETSMMNTGVVDPEIMALMVAHDYTPRGGSFVNTIYLDNHLMGKPTPDASPAPDAGAPVPTPEDGGNKP